MRFLGIDYGAKRIGIAISDEAGTMAFPRGVFDNDSRAIALLEQEVKDQHIGHIVVGDTKSYSGLRNPITDEVEEFVRALLKRTGVPVEQTFEAGSSIEASRYAPEGAVHDDSAAAIILQRFLDTRRHLK